jgi:zinc transporter 9
MHCTHTRRGVETLIASSSDSKKTPTTTIALSLLSGFTFMLVVEQFTSSHSHSEDLALPLHAKDNTSAVSDVPFDDDIVLDELEQDQGPSSPSSSNTATRRRIQAEPNWLVSSNGGVGNAFSLTLGLVIHGVADGLALGMSALADSKSLDISLIVFLALLIHKGSFPPVPHLVDMN